MRTLARILALACFLVALALSLALHAATKGGLFTQLPSESLAKMQEKAGDDPFSGLGMNDLAGAPTAVDNSFRFGWLPAGPGHMFADSASVATVAGPAFLAFLATLFATRRLRKSAKG